MAKKAIRPIRIEGNIAYVPLTKGYEAVIDAADVPLVEGFNWWAKVRTNSRNEVASVYAVMSASRKVGGKKRYLHRVLMAAESCVDHISGDGLDNRRENLRPATKSENGRNRGMQGNNKSGFKGVSFFKPTKKWRAEISVCGKAQSLGYFATKEAAAKAYADAMIVLHGEFGRLR